MKYCKIVEKALRELSHEDLLTYSIGGTLMLAAIASVIDVPGKILFGTSKMYGMTDDEARQSSSVSFRVAQRCKELEQEEN